MLEPFLNNAQLAWTQISLKPKTLSQINNCWLGLLPNSLNFAEIKCKTKFLTSLKFEKKNSLEFLTEWVECYYGFI